MKTVVASKYPPTNALKTSTFRSSLFRSLTRVQKVSFVHCSSIASKTFSILENLVLSLNLCTISKAYFKYFAVSIVSSVHGSKAVFSTPSPCRYVTSSNISFRVLAASRSRNSVSFTRSNLTPSRYACATQYADATSTSKYVSKVPSSVMKILNQLYNAAVQIVSSEPYLATSCSVSSSILRCTPSIVVVSS